MARPSRDPDALRQRVLVGLAIKQARARCAICGETDPVVLQFHHRPGEIKAFNVGSSARNRTLRDVLAEIAKCDVLCANCHVREHARLKGET